MWDCRTYGYDEPTPPDSFILQAVELRSLWQDKACVVAGLRRFGCMVCRWIAQDLSNLRSFLDQHDVRLVGVGPEALGLQEFLDGGYFSGGATLFPDSEPWLASPPSPVHPFPGQAGTYSCVSTSTLPCAISSLCTGCLGPVAKSQGLALPV